MADLLRSDFLGEIDRRLSARLGVCDLSFLFTDCERFLSFRFVDDVLRLRSFRFTDGDRFLSRRFGVSDRLRSSFFADNDRRLAFLLECLGDIDLRLCEEFLGFRLFCSGLDRFGLIDFREIGEFALRFLMLLLREWRRDTRFASFRLVDRFRRDLAPNSGER